MTWIAVGVGVAGAVASAYGTYSVGESKKKVAKYNQRVSDSKAKSIDAAMSTRTSRGHERARQLKASQLAAYQKSGADVSGGTPLLVMAQQAGEIELDILQERRNSMVNAQQMRQTGEMQALGGKVATRAGRIGAGTTLLQGAGRSYQAYSSSKT